MEVFDPSGSTEVTVSFAQRLGSLEGKKVAFLSNEMWQASRTLGLLKTRLQERFPSARLTHIAAGERIQSDAIIESIAREGYDAVIVGNAA